MTADQLTESELSKAEGLTVGALVFIKAELHQCTDVDPLRLHPLWDLDPAERATFGWEWHQ